MIKKIAVSLLSLFLLVTFCVAFTSPGYVMAAVGLTGTNKVGLFEKVETKTLKNIKAGIDSLAVKMGKENEVSYVSEDGTVKISAKKNGADILVNIVADGSKMPEMSYKDFNRVLDMAKDYLKPILDEKQSMGMCSLFFSDAYDLYKKGVNAIQLKKECEGITIECYGNSKTGIISMDFKSTLEIKNTSPSKRKIVDSKVIAQ